MEMKISPFCDRKKNDMAKSQVGFLTFVALPLFQAWNGYSSIQNVLEQLKRNRDYWTAERDLQEMSRLNDKNDDAKAKISSAKTNTESLDAASPIDVKK